MYTPGTDIEYDSHLRVILQDFTIADAFGKSAIKDTFNRIFRDFKSDYKMMTALTMATNWKIWQHYRAGDEKTSLVYNDLWIKVDTYCMDCLKGDEFRFFIEILD